MDWQPIETAPKNQTQILVTVPWLPEPTILFWNVSDEWESPASGIHENAPWDPTHWMPLPAAA